MGVIRTWALICGTLGLTAIYGNSRVVERELYDILGVDTTAEPDEIKRAFRKKSKLLHPDKNPSPTAADEYAKLTQADEILSNKEKRKIYDRHGMAGIQQAANMGGDQGGGFGGGDPFDLFAELFGGGPGAGRRGSSEKPKVKPLEIKLKVSLEQLFFGEVIDVKYERNVVCMNAEDCFTNRKDCKGEGVRVVMQQIGPGFMVQNQLPDPTCVAKGKGLKADCKYCPKGLSYIEPHQLAVTLQPGMTDGDVITFDRAGDQIVNAEHGDVIFEITTHPHPTYKRDGNDLTVTLVINLLEALAGFSTDFKHLDNGSVTITNDTVTHDGQVLFIKGKGMPSKRNPQRFGNLLVRCSIAYPKRLSPDAVALVRRALTGVEYRTT